MNHASPNRTFKDSLFRMIFSERRELLALYNAVNGSHYSDAHALELNTIDDVLYIGMKNDISFLIDSYLNLYEAQASWNPNMPLRGLIYLTHIYEGYIAVRQLDLYSRTRLSIPFPRYIVFYYGAQDEPDRTELLLSDSFSHGDESDACLECRAEVLNINWGHNEELMRSCRKLYEYAYLTAQVRDALKKGMILKSAIDQAVDRCIEHDILKDFLLKHRGEVADMILTGYDTEIHMRTEYKRGVEEGTAAGRQAGRADALRENLLSLLSSFGPVPDDLTHRIQTENSCETLQDWNRFIFQCRNVEDIYNHILP